MREKLIEILNNSFAEQYEKRGLLTAPHTATDLIANGVTIPVHCKDCRHWKPSGSMAGNSEDDLQPIGGCIWTNCCRRANDFCSYGERKTER